ncbi:MAG: glutamyl-tRNA(Gln) amidotransferase, subunit, partial [Klenkia sp.]|nr:glutamyl-tRNA(Gln) amidotransferase, subunit [Klenkia sp.]
MSATELTRLDVTALQAALADGSTSAVEVTRAHLDAITAGDGALNSYLFVDGDAALATAADVDRRRTAGEELGRLAGVPVALKDVVVTHGVPTTSGSKILQGWTPPYDATVAARLKAAGTVLLGKTNMDEFAMGSS